MSVRATPLQSARSMALSTMMAGVCVCVCVCDFLFMLLVTATSTHFKLFVIFGPKKFVDNPLGTKINLRNFIPCLFSDVGLK